MVFASTGGASRPAVAPDSAAERFALASFCIHLRFDGELG